MIDLNRATAFSIQTNHVGSHK